ncbi:hypothetical protein SO802_010066 [Lithocarpus litseifolius]|uniref:Uncharacterized protein n=1 Tax=Lithocarpus litseifolius TaxID=425828 RepID=A0AAW2DEE3_9ROSI
MQVCSSMHASVLQFMCAQGLISLEDESGIQLGIDLLGRRYAIETIYYADLEADFMHRPQGTANECLRMAREGVLPVGRGGRALGSHGPSSVHACYSFPKGCEVQPVEAGHPFTIRVTDELDYDEFSGTRIMPSLTTSVGLAAGAIIDPFYLHWSVYAYNPDSFARENPVRRNTNITSYAFPEGTRAIWLYETLQLLHPTLG